MMSESAGLENAASFVDLLKMINFMEIPEALAELRKFKEIIDRADVKDIGWWIEIINSATDTAVEAVDVTTTEVDDEFVDLLVKLRPMIISLLENLDD